MIEKMEELGVEVRHMWGMVSRARGGGVQLQGVRWREGC